MYKRNILHAQSMKITQNAKFILYHGCLCVNFSVSQSIDQSIRVVHGTYCMSLRHKYTPQGRNRIHLYTFIFIKIWSVVSKTYCNMRLWKFCNYVIQDFACVPWRLVRVSQNLHIHCTWKKYIYICIHIMCPFGWTQS